MANNRWNEATEGRQTFGAALLHAQFSLVDTFRHLQGAALGALGYGPIECLYRVKASGSYWRLRDYNTMQPSAAVLIVSAPIKRPYIWDLAPTISVIRRCLAAGLQVHLLEWLPASKKTCHVGIAECVEAISASLAAIASDTSGVEPTLMGHSLGGTLAAIYAATVPASIGKLVLLGSPLCFWPDESSFRDALISLVPVPVSDCAPYPGSLLSQASVAASPGTFIWSRLMDAAASMGDGHAMDIYARIERWALDEAALPGRLVSEIVELLYRDNNFCRGVLKIGGQTIGPENISAPSLAVVNMADLVAPLHSVSPIAEALGPARFQIIEYPGEVGVCLQHLGILVGRQAGAQIWPKIIDWIAPQSERKLQAWTAACS